MAGNYWIKFYCEILDDPKMATLPDRLWRRFYELCLLAGKQNKDGEIPPVNQIAWSLRMSESDITDDITALVNIGLITVTGMGYVVTSFAKRQTKLSNADKSREYRERQHREEYYGDDDETNPRYQDETISNASALPKVTQITDNRLTDTDNRADVDVENHDDSDRLLTSFCRISCLPIPAVKAIRDTWTEQLLDLKAKGVTENIIRRACKELTEKGTYRITSPKSIIKACEVVMADKKRKNDNGYERLSDNPEFAGIVNR